MSTALVVALSGGIASGKSATTQRFIRHGVPVYDADVIARELVAPGQQALAEITTLFGVQMLTPTGELDRVGLRNRVFAETDARRQLEAILHPRIRAELLQHAHACTAAYCVLAIPLLAECRGDYLWVDRALVADAPSAMQLQRLLHRPGIDHVTATHMMQAQASRAQRLRMADDVIDNTGPMSALDAAVARLHQSYLQLAAAKT